MVEELSFDFEDEGQGVVKLPEIDRAILDARVVFCNLVMVRRVHINDVVVTVEAVNLVARGVFYELPRAVVKLENASEQSIVWKEGLATLESAESHIIYGAHGTIADEGLDDFGELLYQMGGANPTD